MDVDLLLSSGDKSLQEIFLARLDRADCLRKEIEQLSAELAETSAEAETARLLLAVRSARRSGSARQIRIAFPSEFKKHASSVRWAGRRW